MAQGSNEAQHFAYSITSETQAIRWVEWEIKTGEIQVKCYSKLHGVQTEI